MPVKYEVVAKRIGKDDKAFWTKIGIVVETSKGLSLKLEQVPVAWDGWAILSEPKAKGTTAPARTAGDDDDIPY